MLSIQYERDNFSKLLIDQKCIDINVHTKTGTALHIAFLKNNFKIAKILLENQADL